MSRFIARLSPPRAAGRLSRARTLVARASDPGLQGYVEAAALLAAKHPTRDALVEWLTQYRDLSVADRIYRLAVAHSTKSIRQHHKTITVAVVTNIPGAGFGGPPHRRL